MLRIRRRGRHIGPGLALLAGISVIAAACGGDDGGETTATTAKPAQTTAAAAATTAAQPATTQASTSEGTVTVRWFVGLGTGSQAEQIDREKALIDEFNASQDKIHLEAEFVDNNTAKSALAAEIAAGNPPDIIGPVGREGANAFSGQYLNLDPLIKASGIDLTQYEPEQIAARYAPDGTIDSLPFASYPAALYYNKELFDEAGLPYPPKAYGEKYGVGTEYEGDWTVEKMEEIATILTVDSAGVAGDDAAFKKDAVAQWGFVHQWTAPPRAQGTFFGAANIVGDDGTANVPEAWLDEWKWYHHMIHEVGASPTQAQLDGDVLAGNAFNSGKVGMALTHLWYTCCLNTGGDAPEFKQFWDVGALPTKDGVATAKLHADTFRIHKDSKNPDAAFEVLRWIHEEKALEFLTIYGAMPARIDLRQPYFDVLNKNYTQGVNWQAFLDGLTLTDNPSHELDMPSFIESDEKIKELENRINGEPNLDLDAVAKQLETDLDAIWTAAGG